ncbi:carbohydrate esterase family 5 protein [Dothistroma septosporum NZE10]|uniref:cutinase n=1 Tax=Dothistroma septosporum (strain NZE10 / CBS 128990) TaxID=675120 RepID=N1Q4Z3_DOTSN|nr:carbohydrate esterase family 5 protein [Dothistroma septosporum NZE10]
MADSIDREQSILSCCPGTKLVLGVYFQGAMVVHIALGSQSLNGSKIAAAVLSGDPFNGQAPDDTDTLRVKGLCGGTDHLCSAGGGTTGSGSPLRYDSDADAAVQYILLAIGY